MILNTKDTKITKGRRIMSQSPSRRFSFVSLVPFPGTVQTNPYQGKCVFNHFVMIR
jgi:hypothetical protein